MNINNKIDSGYDKIINKIGPEKNLEYKSRFYNIQIDTEIKLYTFSLIKDSINSLVNEEDKFISHLTKKIEVLSSKNNYITLNMLFEEIKLFIQEKNIISDQQTHQHLKIDDIIYFWSQLSGFHKLLPLLLDMYIEEIFTTSSRGNLVIDHHLYGRLRTNIYLSQIEIMNILFKTSHENNSELNLLNPSIRGDLHVKNLITLRVTGDIPPYSMNSALLNIRKLHNIKFSLIKLIELKLMDKKIASFLKTLMINGINITIVGPPTSGKTTLQNVLLRELPKYWKVFSMEQTVESDIDSLNFYKFKIYNYLKKSKDLQDLISQLLHRSPDYVNLGEITTSEEAKSWITCLSAGIPVIQTIHALSMKAIIPRILDVFNISKGLLANSFPHLFIEIRYFWNKGKKIRKLFSISELTIENNFNLKIMTISNYSIAREKMEWIIEPKESNTFQWIKKNKNQKIIIEFERNLNKF